MYYKKHSELLQLPTDIKEACIKIVEDNLKNNVPVISSFGHYETENKTSIAYVEPGSEFVGKLNKKSASVCFYNIPEDLNQKICDFYNKGSTPLTKNNLYFLQIINGSDFVAPHIDSPTDRAPGFLYIIKTGGPNVRTKWYEIKEEFKDSEITYNVCIPYEKLDIMEDHCLEEDCWHWMNFSKIHSVENQETLRIALWGYST